MKKVDLFDSNKNYIYKGELVTIIDELAGVIEENGKEKIILPSQCKCLGDKVKEFEAGKQYIFCKELIPKHLGMPLSGWEEEIDRKPVEIVNEKNGYCFNDKGEAYMVFVNWCKEV